MMIEAELLSTGAGPLFVQKIYANPTRLRSGPIERPELATLRGKRMCFFAAEDLFVQAKTFTAPPGPVRKSDCYPFSSGPALSISMRRTTRRCFSMVFL